MIKLKNSENSKPISLINRYLQIKDNYISIIRVTDHLKTLGFTKCYISAL